MINTGSTLNNLERKKTNLFQTGSNSVINLSDCDHFIGEGTTDFINKIPRNKGENKLKSYKNKRNKEQNLLQTHFTQLQSQIHKIIFFFFQEIPNHIRMTITSN
jgi:hypothetical protein